MTIKNSFNDKPNIIGHEDNSKYCPRCIQEYTDEDGMIQPGTKEPADCRECHVCVNCECLTDCRTRRGAITSQELEDQIRMLVDEQINNN